MSLTLNTAGTAPAEAAAWPNATTAHARLIAQEGGAA